MVRKTKEEAIKTREMILDAAERCFLDHGVSKTTLDTIACSAGCTRGAVYWHFKNKQDLFIALMDRVELPLIDYMNTITSLEHENPLNSLRKLICHALDKTTNDTRMRNAMAILLVRCELVDDMTYLINRQDESRNRFIEITVTLIKRSLVGQNNIDEVQIRHYAKAICAMVTGLMRDWFLANQSYNLIDVGNASVDLLLEGITAKIRQNSEYNQSHIMNSPKNFVPN